MEAQTAALSLFIYTKSDICNYHGQVGRKCSVAHIFPFKYFPSNPSQNVQIKLPILIKNTLHFQVLTFKSCKFSSMLFPHIPHCSLKRFMVVITH